MPDLHRIGKRFQRKVAGLEDVVRVYQAVVKVRAFDPAILKRRSNENILQLPDIIKTLEPLELENEEYQALLESTYLKPLRVSQNISLSCRLPSLIRATGIQRESIKIR